MSHRTTAAETMWNSHGLHCVSLISTKPPGVTLHVSTRDGQALLTERCIDPNDVARRAERLRKQLTAT
jgi:hypothetical protein